MSCPSLSIGKSPLYSTRLNRRPEKGPSKSSFHTLIRQTVGAYNEDWNLFSLTSAYALSPSSSIVVTFSWLKRRPEKGPSSLALHALIRRSALKGYLPCWPFLSRPPLPLLVHHPDFRQGIDPCPSQRDFTERGRGKNCRAPNITDCSLPTPLQGHACMSLVRKEWAVGVSTSPGS